MNPALLKGGGDMFGGRWMDTFMDKLAQKLTAQEIIKANAAADAEELNRLQNQVKEYNECLAQMRQVNQQMQDAVAKMERLMEDEIVPGAERLVDEKVAASIKRLAQEQAADIKQLAQEQAADIKLLIQEQTSGMSGSVEEQMSAISQKMEEQSSQSNDFVHRENVKVYRNVQAVVLDEAGKHREALESAVKTVSGRLNTVLGISIGALAAGVLGLVFQILTYFHII